MLAQVIIIIIIGIFWTLTSDNFSAAFDILCNVSCSVLPYAFDHGITICVSSYVTLITVCSAVALLGIIVHASFVLF